MTAIWTDMRCLKGTLTTGRRLVIDRRWSKAWRRRYPELRVPARYLQAAGIEAGDLVDIEADASSITIRPQPPTPRKA